MEPLNLSAEKRTATGSAESRRLRKQGRVPAIIYGGKGDPLMVSVAHDELDHRLGNEAFFSQIISIKLKGRKTEEVILRDLQRHPARPFIQHADFLRVVAGEKLRMNVPLHFVGEEECPGVKTEEGIVQRVVNEIEIECLPHDLPEYIDVDISALHLNDVVHLSELSVPEGVDIVALINAEEDDDSADSTVVSIQVPRAAVEETEELEEAEAAAEGEETAEAAAAEEQTGEDNGGGDEE